MMEALKCHFLFIGNSCHTRSINRAARQPFGSLYHPHPTMRKLMLRSQSGRRRSRYAPQLCAASAALLLLLSLSVLHSRLSSSPFPVLAHPHLSNSTDNPSNVASDDAKIDVRSSAVDDDDNIDESDLPRSPGSGFFWDHALGVTRCAFAAGARQSDSDPWAEFPPELHNFNIGFGSDDQPVDEAVRLKLDSIKNIEDALMLKMPGGGDSPMRDGWARWLEGKAGFLRGDRMLRSNMEAINPRNHPLLQDPDVAGGGSLTRGDKLMQRAIWKELESTPFPGGGESKRVETRRKTLQVADERRPQPCSIRVFMVWNSPSWMFGVRHQRGLESLLYHHKDACVVVFSETLEQCFFSDFVKDGFSVEVVMPNLDELLEDTPVREFASLWFEWNPVHYSELVRLAALYKYGGVYLDSDIIVLKSLYSLETSVGVEDQMTGDFNLNGAVMSFKRHSPFLMECMVEFYSTYDDTGLRWNGAELLTRVINRLRVKGEKSDEQLGINIGSSVHFFPVSSMNITRYFMAPADEFEKAEQDALITRILNESTTFHFWNGLTSGLIPEPSSLAERLLNQYCLRCLDKL